MLKRFYPDAYVESVFAIDYEALYRRGIRGLIFDIDNTLVHHGDDSTPAVDRLFERVQAMGFQTLLLTDNHEQRVRRFIRNIDTLYICEAGKPDPAPYRRALELMGLERHQVVCIGDQIFRDILGANRSGLPSILVRFIRLPTEGKIGRRRQLEKAILWCYRRSPSARHRLGNIEKTMGNEMDLG